MFVALHDSDDTNFPNLALMKIAAWHRQLGAGWRHEPVRARLLFRGGFAWLVKFYGGIPA